MTEAVVAVSAAQLGIAQGCASAAVQASPRARNGIALSAFRSRPGKQMIMLCFFACAVVSHIASVVPTAGT